MRRDWEPDELESLLIEGNDLWADGYVEGRIEILGSLIPDLIPLIDAVLAEEHDLPDSVLTLLETLDRWIEHYRHIESEGDTE